MYSINLATTMDNNLHIFFLPFLAPGHMIPMVDLAKLFAARPGLKSTLITTTPNAPLIQPTISHHPNIQLLTLPPFPSSTPHNVSLLPSPDFTPEFIKATNSLEDHFDSLLHEHHPDCIISDVFFPWSADLAARHGIPRLAFHGTSCFTTVVLSIVNTLKPHEGLTDESTPFVVPTVPHRIELTKSQLPNSAMNQDQLILQIVKSYKNTYGSVMNTFNRLEEGYADKQMGKSWLVGPVSFCNRDMNESAVRGGTDLSEFESCMNWLDTKKPRSVLYVCFGSLGQFTCSQLREIAIGLENSDCEFIWVVRNSKHNVSEWMPKDQYREKGLIIQDWAPQMAILSHTSVGGFMTHCGWNSCLEGVSVGIPMVTWPQFAEQFLNERLLVDVLGVGVGVGARVCSGNEEKRTFVKGEEVRRAVREVMGGGDEAEGRRKRAKEAAAEARKAMEEGGSSYMDMSRLIEELRDVKKGRSLGLVNRW